MHIPSAKADRCEAADVNVHLTLQLPSLTASAGILIQAFFA